MKHYSVVIYSACDDMEPWISVFSDRRKAEDFMQEAKSLIAMHDLDGDLRVAIDSGSVDSRTYLECLKANLEE